VGERRCGQSKFPSLTPRRLGALQRSSESGDFNTAASPFSLPAHEPGDDLRDVHLPTAAACWPVM